MYAMLMQACEHVDEEMREQLQQVAAQAAALRCAAHAEAVAGEATDAEGVRKGVGGIHLASTSSGPQTTGVYGSLILSTSRPTKKPWLSIRQHGWSVEVGHVAMCSLDIEITAPLIWLMLQK